MIRMPVEKIIEKLKDASGVSEEEIRGRIRAKLDELAGLISEEGAAHIIANDLGIKLFDQTTGRLKITNILAGMRAVEMVGKVQTIYPVKEFTRKDGATGKVASLWVADDTASMRVTLWGDQTDNVSSVKEGDTVKVVGAYVKDNNGRAELHLNDKSELIVNPEGEEVGEVKTQAVKAAVTRTKIVDLSEGMSRVELLATIVQTFDVRFFEMCPDCKKRVRQRGEDSFVCDEHGTVKPYYSYVLNAFLDDGSDAIRAVFWANQVQSLLGKEDEAVQGMREDSEKLEELKQSVLGKIVKVGGAVKKNQMFDRLEFNVFEIDANPDPIKEMEAMGVSKQEVPSIMELEGESNE
ncbi:DUF2240 family protein [Candidatus Woesearchaeota archaeon]|jgi:replication factor A1|nr:DUF2240 family protein [Candidatus Woesearchaeota archaeon]MBT7928425.1 DUF2240 family protein [Candidatus Peregrinibacteria bacterium]MBT3537217.1 DUF2240 family protein [Candidatus Woesearchaeota archaeon]MBT4698204.1 DUF2240 family protein [Candidatus Woesearchaeota archaeon]MBT4717751.1 DUF2240 family protein [Candidatus Woesearchaeota archaeon]